MECRVSLVRKDVSEERVSSIIGVGRINEIGTTLAVTSIKRATRRHIPEDGNLYGNKL
jgi:hypothetical protein